MATVSQPMSEAPHRAQLMRQPSNGVKGRGATVLAVVASFFLFHPPLAQGMYYLLRGLWPLFRMGQTGASTATDTDIWLAQSGGVLTLAVGAVLCLAAYRREGSMEVIVLAFGTAFGLTLLELIYVVQGRISELYLLDMFAQVALVASWVYGWRKMERARARAALVSQAPGVSQPAAIPLASQPTPA